ncbi:chorismate mutase/prephenate dehydratase [Streptococcus pneumoniae]|nr:chorismate mutase [Streptococcus pneumoniae]CEX04938.1 chorismate mutase/prephenate dehydratase [Streptococcus pneumoniae]CIN60137.1 chorismate mutase/prephenate dehydratase [Streptococcus pneumoniae]CIY44910.1 chorismate mutase/prephenate dehydratase [Streptococcus pneumoniae]CJD87798.1 chorismate mutase/prephenate dehydratase [Streptococcus pneumoniae]CJD95526.1 chorismate mutase/prephenate dehydratase [Streptococcus pneumoniae]
MDLDIIRQEIDQIDDQIVKLLEERMHLVEEVVAYKKASGKPILDTKRETVIFEKIRSRVEDKRYQETIVATFSDILKRSRDYQDQNIKWKKNNFIR